jgi:hypothetical protein
MSRPLNSQHYYSDDFFLGSILQPATHECFSLN